MLNRNWKKKEIITIKLFSNKSETDQQYRFYNGNNEVVMIANHYLTIFLFINEFLSPLDSMKLISLD